MYFFASRLLQSGNHLYLPVLWHAVRQNYLQIIKHFITTYFLNSFKKRIVRDIASAIFILRSVFSLGVTLFTPCVALYTIIDVPIYASLLALTGISICFTLFVHITIRCALSTKCVRQFNLKHLLMIISGRTESCDYCRLDSRADDHSDVLISDRTGCVRKWWNVKCVWDESW